MRIIFAFLLSQLILLPIIAGLIRLRRLDRGYQPFFLLLLIGFLTEVIGFIVIQGFRKSNLGIVNVYVLIEWTLIAWQFHVWGLLQQRKKAFYALLLFFAVCWAVENYIYGSINGFMPYFHFLYFFAIVLLSINKINFMITHENRMLFRNPKFLICIGFIIYFMYMIVDYWALEMSLYGEKEISVKISFLMGYVNALANIIYAVAFLLLPKPLKFTLE